MFVRSDSIGAADIIWNSLENQLWLRQECEMISVETSNMYQNFPHIHISNSSEYSGIKVDKQRLLELMKKVSLTQILECSS